MAAVRSLGLMGEGAKAAVLALALILKKMIEQDAIFLSAGRRCYEYRDCRWQILEYRGFAEAVDCGFLVVVADGCRSFSAIGSKD